ncbi:hypothetical protein [Burkholderia contaminans]|uniref:Phage-related protein n=1 Tax=Burkholderia contaminans TaxID=488447 RepID=A0A6P3B904_9BURK|nr:hypothetical protein [Burkholderia contaminans]VWD52326.1 hypothetical protein BCO71033_05462 [Burkholderia contaminans]
MNKLPQPQIDDAGALQRLSNNARVKSFPHLQAIAPQITAGYVQYRAALGDAHKIANIELPAEVKGYLKAHYASPPGDLSYITALRQDDEDRICPMCGSMHRGTLDHVLPKEVYTAFAVFSFNLVPACKCNINRGQRTVGIGPAERILHPYFDDCLGDRLIAARFEDLGRVPRVSLKIMMDRAHPQYGAVGFHVQEIVSKTAILKYLVHRWEHLCQKPERVIRALTEPPQSEDDLQRVLLKDLELTDEIHDGKNNWDSVFVCGLLDNDVMQWLFVRLTAPNRPAGGSLV